MKFMNYTQTNKNIFYIASNSRPRNDGNTYSYSVNRNS